MTKKIYFFKFDATPSGLYIPVVYFGFKNYYNQNSKYADQWSWQCSPPEYAGWSVDQIVDEAVSHQADVYAFSSYMWSWNLIRTIAPKIRERLPNSILVLGGPHQGTKYAHPLTWFRKNPAFDATCLAVEYGEFFIQDVLDCIHSGNLDWSQVRNSFSRSGQGPIPNKLDFKFPSGLLADNLDEALEYTRIAREKNLTITMLYEGARGCPYGCTYCEWAGGINTKVVSKPLEYIQDDLSYIPLIEARSIFITDANFGLLKDDAAKAESLASLNMNPTQPISLYLSGLAKTSVAKRLSVLEPMMKTGAMQSYNMSIQSINPQVLKNIDRTDITIEQQIEMARYLIDKYDCEVHVELILGLPGMTLDDYYQECDVVYNVFNKYSGVTRDPLYILPDSPAADPKYIERWKLELVPLGMEQESSEVRLNDYSNYLAIYDPANNVENTVWIPVASESYTRSDWKQMYFLILMDLMFVNQHIFIPFIDFMARHRNYMPSRLMPKVYSALTKVNKFYHPIDVYLEDIVQGRMGNRDWRVMKADDTYTDHSYRAIMYLWNRYRMEIYQSLRIELADILDEQSLDCLMYTENSTFRDDQDCHWDNKWAWDEWETGKDKSIPPKKQQVKYQTQKTSIDFSSMTVQHLRTINTVRLREDGLAKINLRHLSQIA